jgi:2-phosphoglycerate kinase
MTISQLRKKIQDNKKPLVILIGGMSGTGKSLTAVQLAAILHLPIIISTDQIRDVMTLSNHSKILNARYTNAWKLFGKEFTGRNFEQGVLEHSKAVRPGVVKVIKDCLSRGEDIIVEGTHLLPSLYKNFFGAIVLRFLLVTYETQYHQQMLREKYEQRHSIPKPHSSEKIRVIRLVQDVLVRDAERSGSIIVVSRSITSNCKAIENVLKKTYASGLNTLS